MEFNEIVAQLREPGEDGLPETIYDDLTLSYTTALDGAAERLAQTEGTVAELVAEVARLKGVNYDLLMSAGDGKATSETETTPSDDPTDPISELFDKG